jgi:hypothetical protein
LQITDMLSQAGDRVQVKHAIEVYAESFDLDNNNWDSFSC